MNSYRVKLFLSNIRFPNNLWNFHIFYTENVTVTDPKHDLTQERGLGDFQNISTKIADAYFHLFTWIGRAILTGQFVIFWLGGKTYARNLKFTILAESKRSWLKIYDLLFESISLSEISIFQRKKLNIIIWP